MPINQAKTIHELKNPLTPKLDGDQPLELT